MQKWEYVHAFGELGTFAGITVPVVSVVNGQQLGSEEQRPAHEWLQQMGEDGWELVTVVGADQFRGFYLKREKEA